MSNSLNNQKENVPEIYIYNNIYSDKKPSDKEIIIDVDHIVYDLIKCGKDKNRFYSIMSAVEKEILGDDYLIEEEHFLKNTKENNNTFINAFHDQINSAKKTDLGNEEKKNIKKFVNPSPFNNNQNEGNSLNNFEFNPNNNFNQNYTKQNGLFFNHHFKESKVPYKHKKYTDVHANTKFYYPDDFYYENSDLSVEPSQWTDRTNRSLLYTNTQTSFYNNSLYNEALDNSKYIWSNNDIGPDNTKTNSMNANLHKRINNDNFY